MKKRILIGGGILIFLIFAGIFTIFLGSISAVSNFRENATSQLNPIISGKNLESSAPVKLAEIPFADLINPTYKRVKNSAKSYEKLLSDARNYSLAKKSQEALATIYNKNSVPDAKLTADILTSVNKYLATMKNNFPGETSRISALQNLANLVSSSTTFAEISDALAGVIQENSTWLNGLRDSLNAEIANFQKSVN